jgi:flagellar hook assembly protein FlgD
VNSDITANKWGVYASSSNPYVAYNNIHANTTAGVWNSTTSPDVDARENWWGVATGPTYTAGNPGGRGDSINDHVLYNPWLGQLTGSNLSITEARAMPGSLNPNGGHVTFTARLSSSATWTITINDGSSNTVNTFTGTGTTIKQKWYGVDSQSIKVADGPYYCRIDAQEPASGASASSPEGLLMVSSQVPIIYMDPPVDNQMFTGGTTINITGRISDTDFKNYTLDYGVGGNPASWINLKPTTTTPVMDGLIYSWNTSALTGSVYTIRLTVNDNAGNTVVDTARVRFLWMQNAAASQSYISPNGDGLQDATTVSATFNYPSVWTITLNNSSGSPVKSYSGTATTLSQDWDGTNDEGTIVADGIYTYQITAVSSDTGIQATPKTGIITVDTTTPTALITTPGSNAILWGTVQITGNALDANFDTYKVEYGPAAGNGPWTLINSGRSSTTNNTLATWITNDPSLPVPIQNGSYIIKLTVTDRAGNTSISSVPVILDDLQLSNVANSANAINTLNAESSTIFFTLNSPATVTLKIIPEKQGPTGAPIYHASQSCIAAGAYSVAWSGKDNSGKVVPDEAYIYILEATDGIKTTSYNPPVPTGTGTITCSGSTFDPAKNLHMVIAYAPSKPSRVNINIQWGVLRYKVLDAFPATPSSHTFVWYGRNPGNKLLDTDAYSSCSIASLLQENYIITSGDTVMVTDLKTDPYALQISYGQFTRITYTLSRDANVTVKLTSPSGSIRTLVSNQFQAAGPQALDEWTGLDAADPTGMKTLITEEGDYTVSVQAVNPTTGTSSTTRANIRIGY